MRAQPLNLQKRCLNIWRVIARFRTTMDRWTDLSYTMTVRAILPSRKKYQEQPFRYEEVVSSNTKLTTRVNHVDDTLPRRLALGPFIPVPNSRCCLLGQGDKIWQVRLLTDFR